MDANFYGGCNDMASLLGNSADNSFCWIPSSSSFNGTMMNFDGQQQQLGGLLAGKRNRYSGLLAHTSDENDTDEEESEKKRRLTSDQAKHLEKAFEEDSRLEPEKKAELAKLLGLKPRQISIWYQNKRARRKSKQIEEEYDTLKGKYESLKVDYDSLNIEKQLLQNEIEILKNKLAEKERNEIPIIGTHRDVGEIGTGVGVVMLSTMQDKGLHCKDGNQPTQVHVEASSNLMFNNQVHEADFSRADEEHAMMMNNNLLMPQSPLNFDNFLNGQQDVNYDPNFDSYNFSMIEDESFWSTMLL